MTSYGGVAMPANFEAEQVTSGRGSSVVQWLPTRLIHEMLEEQAQRTPSAIAVVCEGKSLTYAELSGKANQLARYLREKGVRPGQVVGICIERSLDMVVGLLGILKAGAAYVPLDPAYPTERLAYILRDAAPQVLLIQASLNNKLACTTAEVIELDSDWGRIAEESSSNLDMREFGLRPDYLAYVIYTSGSTGEPKGVMVEHRNVTRLFSATEALFGFDERDVWTLFHSIAFDFSVWELWGALLHGGRVVVVPYLTSRSPQEFYRLICLEGVTVLNQTPSAFAQLVDAQAKDPECKHSLRLVIFGGEALEFRTLRPWVERNGAQNPSLVNMYGITETTVHATYRLLSAQEIESGEGSLVGGAIPDLKAYLLDRHSQPAPIGVAGEIYIGGAGVARGYLNRPELTAERFVANPFSTDPTARLYKSGDLGRWKADGTIEYLGRNDHQVKIRGYRIELGEIEAQLARHPQVKEAVVTVREDTPGERRLVGYVSVNPSQLKAKRQADTIEAAEQMVNQWKSLYEDTYSRNVSGPNFVGWNSSFTGRSIPDEQMRDWLQNTLQRIRSLKPRRVLEIGCGMGLLLEQLAPGCEVYRGTDVSGTAVECLRKWLATRAELQHVQVDERSALDFDGLELCDYDTVILNSVVQYFPDAAYLRAVLEKVSSSLSPSGKIFVGDVRNLGLLPSFHTAVQMERAAANVTATTLKKRIARAIEFEKELLLRPQFFLQLPRDLHGIGRVQTLMKRGKFNNELTRYRYDVLLEVGEPCAPPISDRIDWESGNDILSVICARLAAKHRETFRVCGIKDSRLSRDIAAVELVDTGEHSVEVGSLRDILDKRESDGEDPEAFWILGERYGYVTLISWNAEGKEGCFDVEYRTHGDVFTQSDNIKKDVSLHTVDTFTSAPTVALANDPLGKALKGRLVPALRNYLKERLPSHMIPGALMVLESFPLTLNGKLDRQGLPSPDAGAYASREYEKPAGRMEEILAEIWEELLRVDRVGRQDNFFELGGNSLLIVQMIDRLRQGDLFADVRTVFESPTLAVLAGALGGKTGQRTEVPPNGIPPGCERITPEMLPLVDLELRHIEQIAMAVPGGAKNIQDIYPLLPLQEGILFHHLLNDGGGDIYVVAILLSISSHHKLEHFVAALQAVIDRHDALRTAVQWEQMPSPVQVVYRRATLPVVEIVLDGARDPTDQIREWILPERQRLDLRTAPLMRLQSVLSPDGSRYVLLQFHHLICDNNSLDILLAEVSAHINGRAHELPEPEPFRRHVAKVVLDSRTQEAEAFFRKKLAEVDEPSTPFGLMNVRGDGSGYEEAHETLGATLASRIRSQARHYRVSAATLFHAAWALVVSRTSGRDDVVFGSVLLGRLQGLVDAQHTIGLFINTLPLRLNLRGLTARSAVERTQRELVELLGYEQAPLALAQSCSGVGESVPLFSTLLNYKHRESKAGYPGAEAPALISRRSWTNYPIALSVEDCGDDGFALTAQTDRRIDPGRIARYMSAAIRSLTNALEDSPDVLALSLEIMPIYERRQITELFNETQAVYPYDKQIHQLFEEEVRKAPNAIAAVYGVERLTYGELNRRANQLARFLRSQGVGPDRLVGLCVERGFEMVIALLAVSKAGGAYVPLDPSYPSERLAYMIENSEPCVLLTQERLKNRIPSATAPVVAFDSRWMEIATCEEDNLAPGESGADSRNLCYVIYTSGSTGQPKGVMIEHRGLCNLAAMLKDVFGAQTGSRVLQFASLSFDACAWEWVMALCSGACLCLFERSDLAAGEPLQLTLSANRITHATLPPVVLGTLSSDQEFRDLSTLIVAGEACSSTLMERWAPGRHFTNAYGPTEATVCATLQVCGPRDTGAPPIGRPISNARIYVLDSNCRPVPVGVPGEIWIGGVGVARGYLGRPDLTMERFLPDPFGSDPLARLYRSGDIGKWRPDGTIEYMGRSDSQVKLRGHRIELDELRARLLGHPQVDDAVVIVREDVRGDQRLVAYVVCRDCTNANRGPRVEALREHLKGCLPEYMIPGAFVILARLPLTPNGKLDRRALPVPELEAYVSRQYEAPEGEVEGFLATIWQHVLGIPRVGREDNFFQLGGHSLLAMQVMVRIRSSLSVELPVSAFFEFRTLRQLSARVEALRRARLLERIQGDGVEMQGLLAKVASIPEDKVQGLMRELRNSTP